MSLRFRYSDPRGIDEPATMVTLGSNIRWGEGGFALSAELAQAAISGVGVDDPGGIYDLVGLRAFEVAETSAPSNNQIIGRFAIGDQTIGRNEDRALITGADRYWDLDLADYNWHAGKRVLVDADSNRPEETAGDRLRWLINDAAHINLNDYGHVTYPTRQLDAVDFRLQRPMDVLADCAVEDGYLFWVDYNEAHGKPELFFIDPDSTTYQATIGVSNVADYVDHATVFYPYTDAKLVRTPRAIAFGVALPYQNGFVYVRKDSTGQQFAKQDQVAPMKNVKKAARARRIANRFLNQNDEQSERLSFALKVPWAQVNDVRHGQLMNVLFSHLPGYTTWTGVRVLRKFVSQEPEGGDDYALLQIEAVPSAAVSEVPDTTELYQGTVFAGLQRSDDYAGPILGYGYTFPAPPAGWYTYPTTGPISIDQGSAPFTSVTVSADMEVRIDATAWASGVGGSTHTIYVRVNGAEVGSDSFSPPGGFWQHQFHVDLRNYVLAPGDVVSVTGTASTAWTTFGTNSAYLMVGRGTFDFDGGGTDWVGP